MMEYALEELIEWMENDDIIDACVHEDYEDVMCYTNRSRNTICVRRDANGNILDAWMEW